MWGTLQSPKINTSTEGLTVGSRIKNFAQGREWKLIDVKEIRHWDKEKLISNGNKNHQSCEKKGQVQKELSPVHKLAGRACE